jgi:hypothetical protein
MEMTTRRLGMKLGKQPPPKRKHSQALDLVASMAKTWSEWHLAKRATESVRAGAKKAADLRPGKPSGLKRAVTGTPAKITGAVAVVGGLGAIAKHKLRSGGDAESYTPPAPHEPAAAPPPPPQPTATPSPTASAIVHDAVPPPTLQAAPPPDAEVVTELDEPVEKVEMPDANLLIEEPAAPADADVVDAVVEEPEADVDADEPDAVAAEADADADADADEPDEPDDKP